MFVLDFLFAFTVREHTKMCKSYKKFKDLAFLDNIFNRVKQKFNFYNVSLSIKTSTKVNAYAVGSLRKNIIVLTTGILNDYADKCENREQFLTSIEGIIAHEMSHIINKDYFPTLLLIINERALSFVSRVIFIIFNIVIKVVFYFPFIGRHISTAISSFYSAINYVINFFYDKIIVNIYTFFQLQISKQVEYRADRQAAQEIGGEEMAFTLSLLGKSGFFNIFSSHPKTQNRVNRAKKIQIIKGKYLNGGFLSDICFLFSFIALIYLTIKTFKMADVPKLIYDYKLFSSVVHGKYATFVYKISDFFIKFR
jgi:Zn-dependent protease with chaperone function